jgi:hypothetical protein
MTGIARRDLPRGLVRRHRAPSPQSHRVVPVATPCARPSRLASGSAARHRQGPEAWRLARHSCSPKRALATSSSEGRPSSRPPRIRPRVNRLPRSSMAVSAVRGQTHSNQSFKTKAGVPLIEHLNPPFVRANFGVCWEPLRHKWPWPHSTSRRSTPTASISWKPSL